MVPGTRPVAGVVAGARHWPSCPPSCSCTLTAAPAPRLWSLFPRHGPGNCLSSGVPQADFRCPCALSLPALEASGPGLPRSSCLPVLQLLPLSSHVSSPSVSRPFGCTSTLWLCPPAAASTPGRPAWRGRPPGIDGCHCKLRGSSSSWTPALPGGPPSCPSSTAFTVLGNS